MNAKYNWNPDANLDTQFFGWWAQLGECFFKNNQAKNILLLHLATSLQLFSIIHSLLWK